jgi:DNA-binding transcriptional LysR family regulator
MESLPPLPTLVTFEATARLGSFTRAASELCLTQSAVSRQIAQLEGYLGRALFERDHMRIRLTISGQHYFEFVSRMLNECIEATSDIRTRANEQRLIVACSSAVGRLWIAPLLGAFVEQHPEAEVRLMVVDSLGTLNANQFDLAIYYLRSTPPAGLKAECLFKEVVGAYCAPDYLMGRQLQAKELLQHRLLVLEDSQRQWIQWPQWFAQLGISEPVKRQIVCNNYAILTDWAQSGHGIMLGWHPMIDRLVENCSLVRACCEDVLTDNAYFLLKPRDRLTNRIAKIFEAWLLEQPLTGNSG